jgi:uncharacterized membrane protein YeaQ/YmgE (transglycosylase-associated protein family)
MGEIIGALLIGMICGGLASAIVPGKTPGGIVGVVLVGIAGSIVGRILFGLVGLGASWFLGSIVMGVIGAVIVLIVVGRLQASQHPEGGRGAPQ